MERGLAAVMQLRPVTYHWKDKSQDKFGGQRTGLLAQDVEKFFPELIGKNASKDKATGLTNLRSMSYVELVVPVIKAIQELQVEVQELRKKK